jgi:hypothetical protein
LGPEAGRAKKKGPTKRKPRAFGRALLPPAKYHTTKKGARGYCRRRARGEEKTELEGAEAEGSAPGGQQGEGIEDALLGEPLVEGQALF